MNGETEDDRLIKLLTTICENPGWQPAEPLSSTVERDLGQLQNQGWILPRLDGWEASPEAVQCYPNFYFDYDGQLRGETTEGAPPARDEMDRPGYERPAPEPASDDPWEATFTLPRLSVGEKQQVQAQLDLNDLKGGLSLTNTRNDGQRVEAEITVRIRRVR